MHTVALQMISNLLRDAGYTVLMLGPDVRWDALAESAARHEPQVVCLSATMPDASDRLMIAIHEIERSWTGAGYVPRRARLSRPSAPARDPGLQARVGRRRRRRRAPQARRVQLSGAGSNGS